MATQAQVMAQPARDQLLRRALMVNTLISLVCGAGLLLDASSIVALLGAGSPLSLEALGVVTLAFGAAVWAIARRNPINASHARIILAIEIACVLASLLVIALNPFGLSSTGRWAIAGAADLMAVIALCEYLGLRRLARS